MSVTFLLLGTGCTQNDTVESLPTRTESVTQTPEPSTGFIADPLLAKTPMVSNIRIPPGDVLTLAKTSTDAKYTQATDAGAEVIEVDNNRSFVVWWQPEGFDPKTDTVVVSLGGHAGWATRDYVVWKDLLEERGYAFLSVQWWFGRSLESAGYYQPNVIYGLIRDTLRTKGVTPGNVIFQAYSMGSANSYAVTGFDRWEGDQFFAVTIANSGVYEADFPPNAKLPTYSDQPYANTNWILYCATHDEEHPSWNECQSMDKTQSQIEAWGGDVALYIKDSVGTHGSFMMNKANANQALDVAETFLKIDGE